MRVRERGSARVPFYSIAAALKYTSAGGRTRFTVTALDETRDAGEKSSMTEIIDTACWSAEQGMLI
jgi:hypothetical protein